MPENTLSIAQKYELACLQAIFKSRDLKEKLYVNACIGFGEDHVPIISNFIVSFTQNNTTVRSYRNGNLIP